MNDQKMNKQQQGKDGVNPVTIAVAGAVVGAGIAVAGVLLSDKKNREKVIKASTTLKDDVASFVKKTQKQIEEEKKLLEKRMLADKIKVKKVVASAKQSLDKTTKEVNNAVKSL
ncbi:MAG: hypothetical protein WAV30_05270 [Microgenomates group bacterium]